MLKSRLLGAVGIVAVVGGVLVAQMPASPAFEVASIKLNRSGLPFEQFQIEGGVVRFINTSLRPVIRNVYDIRDPQLIGGPGWLDVDRFDIVAKADLSVGDRLDLPRVKLMARALLADRFKLVVHDETREMPIYALVLARRDGTLGPQFHHSTVDCTASTARCGAGKTGDFTMHGEAIPMGQLLGGLLPWVDRFIEDRTGLTGIFDVDLQWTPDRLPPGAGPPGGLPPVDPNRPSIFTAVQEQLGLKLESAKGPVDVLVIDHVERPTED